MVPGHDISAICFRESRQTRFLLPRLTCYRLSSTDLGAAVGNSVLSAIPRTREEYADVPRGFLGSLKYVSGGSLGPPPQQNSRNG